MADTNRVEGSSCAGGARTPGRAIGLLGLVLGVLALGTPLAPQRWAFFVLGVCVLLFGLLQNMTGFALRERDQTTSWWSRGGSSILTGLLLLFMPKLTFAGLALLLGLSWIAAGGGTIAAALRHRRGTDWIYSVCDGLVNVALGAAIAVQWPLKGLVSISLFVGLRYLSTGWSLLLGTRQAPAGTAEEEAGAYPDPRLGLPPHPYVAERKAEMVREEAIRGPNDRRWCWFFLLTFLAIHTARMDAEWTLVGILSPAAAVAGDVLLAIVLAYGLVAPLTLAWRTLTRGLERSAWRRRLAAVDQGKEGSPFARWWLDRRLRGAVRRNLAQGSPTAALGWGLRTGLPFAAILIAVTPLWGVNWVFDTETWVTGTWEIWAEQRTDTWREAMVRDVRKVYGDEPELLRIRPEGVEGTQDFSFLVIGDTGEGDASQLILKDQLLRLGSKPEVKFLVLSSDVIYPAGAMRHYEPKFYMPFHGFEKPIYGLPGNHDWYDALEAFTANFYEPEAARASLRARRAVDLGLTTTTEERIDELVAEAARLRSEYRLQVGKQRAPYFEIHGDAFSLIVVDTGIQRRVDEDQMRWLEEALQRAGNRFKMAILGHPLYAAGHYQGSKDENFGQIHALLKKHGVAIAMGGDTHDFEFYKETFEADGGSRTMAHFVNGGGGAYLSIGTALSWPKQPPVAVCGHYPRADALRAHLDRTTPRWKQPLWWWVRDLHAWPASPEAFAAAFDYDRAPFFQCFMEVRVEGSANRVRLLLYGANGRLRWRDLHVEGSIPGGGAADDLVEFTYPLERK